MELQVFRGDTPLIVVALLVRPRLGSPELFRQQRARFEGKIFELLKVRTLTNASDGQIRYLFRRAGISRDDHATMPEFFGSKETDR